MARKGINLKGEHGACHYRAVSKLYQGQALRKSRRSGNIRMEHFRSQAKHINGIELKRKKMVSFGG